MPIMVIMRRTLGRELCSAPLECQHATCRRYRDMQASPCLYCGQPINQPIAWVADLRTPSMIDRDVWFAGFAHVRCLLDDAEEDVPRFPRRTRAKPGQMGRKAYSKRRRMYPEEPQIDDPRFPPPESLDASDSDD